MAPSKRKTFYSGGGSPGSSFRASNLNYRPNPGVQSDRGIGTKPTTSPSSIGLIMTTMLLHVCKKSLLFDTSVKVGIYFLGIVLISGTAEAYPPPKTYFARSDNVFNRFFVKWSWAWLLSVIVPWLLLTSQTIGCGRRSVTIKHVLRIMIATFMWLVCTKWFTYIENTYGRCMNTKDLTLQTKSSCLKAGKFWRGFDISGHSFILIYASLILAEEGAALVGWEGINDIMVKEEYSRNMAEKCSGALSKLTDTELSILKKNYRLFSPYIRGLFVGMTLQQILWDVMLVSTMLYYHSMAEKFIGGAFAVLVWFFTYRWLFKICLMSPGEGIFKYNVASSTKRGTLNGSTQRFNCFMGIPTNIAALYRRNSRR
uniref:FIT family protein n=1 Tax=Bracon brevicornis TaxID=1563983 RepID=A0A6V7HM69_9HYME